MTDTSDFFDFGFTATEYDPTVLEEKENRLNDYKRAFELLYNDIEGLLDNLQKNPEKDYIYWPNRTEKVQEFRKRIQKYDPNKY